MADRYRAFLNFFESINQEVKDGTCGLESAAYALEPGCNDDDIEADLTFLQDAVEDMKIISRTDEREARGIWVYIVQLMGELSRGKDD